MSLFSGTRRVMMTQGKGIVVEPGTQTFNTSGTWVAPPGVTQITVEAWGGGGNGGTRIDAGSSMGGGGGGAYARGTIPVTPGNTYTVTRGGASQASRVIGDNSQKVEAVGGASTSSSSGGAGGTAAASTGNIG